MKRFTLVIGLILLASFLVVACDSGQEATEPASTAAPGSTEDPGATEVPAPDAVPTDASGAVSTEGEPADDGLTGTLWKWEAYQDTAGQNNIAVDSPDSYTLVFMPDSTIQIQADCNLVGGSYMLQGAALTIELGPSTMAFCGEGSLDQQYLGLLAGTATYVMNEGKLVLNLVADSGNLIFASGGSAQDAEPQSGGEDLVGPAWQWAELIETEPAGQSVVPNPEAYTLNFLLDGSFNYLADCNSGSGTYTTDGHNLSLQLGPVTMAECGTESLFDQYQALLGQVRSYEVREGRLRLNLAKEGDQMVYTQPGDMGGYGTGIDVNSITLDTLGLPYSWQPNVVPGTPYDDSQPPGPSGMPEHIQINFGSTDPEDKRPGDPVIYIIPLETYWLKWELNGDPTISTVLEHLEAVLAERPLPVPPFGMPVLPMEEIGGVNDLAVQGKYLESDSFQGVRFVGRFVQDANPVSNEGLRYVFQGFSADGQYLIAFFYPVTTQALPTADSIPTEEHDRVSSDMAGYLGEKVEMLNRLASSDWAPELATLDTVLSSLHYETTEDNVGGGLTDTVWQWSELIEAEPANQSLVPNPQSYQIIFGADGQYTVQADCNSGSGTYSLEGVNITLAPGPLTAAECGPDSLHDQYLNLLGQVRTYTLVGRRLLLNLKADAGRMVFGNAGPAQ